MQKIGAEKVHKDGAGTEGPEIFIWGFRFQHLQSLCLYLYCKLEDIRYVMKAGGRVRGQFNLISVNDGIGWKG